MENEIKEAIEKNLPNAVGEVLQERLKQAKADATENKSLKEKVDNLEAEVHRLEAVVRQHSELDERREALDGREHELYKAELRAEAQQELQNARVFEAEQRANVIFQFAEMVFKDRRLVRRVEKTESIPMKDSSGYPTTVQTSKTETTTVEEE